MGVVLMEWTKFVLLIIAVAGIVLLIVLPKSDSTR